MTQEETTTNAYRKELRKQVLATAAELFYRHGVRHVKMDDIANALTISKRTLYETYANKADLLLEVVTACEEQKERQLHAFVEAHPDTMDVVLEFYRMNIAELSEINPLFFEDIHKYPAVTGYLRDKSAARQASTSAFIERGVREGYFRSDVNFEIFRSIGEASSLYFMSTKLYHRFPMEDLFRTLIMVLLRGICTERGVKAIDEHLK